MINCIIDASYDQYAWRSRLTKCPLHEQDLTDMKLMGHKDAQRKLLYKSSERDNCTLMQGAGFLYKRRVYLTLGVGSINILEAFSQFGEVEGIVGTGNALFLSKDFKNVYSTLSYEETINRYEIDKTNRTFKYSEGGPIGPLIVLNRVFCNYEEYVHIKGSRCNDLAFDLGNAFFVKPMKFGHERSRLRAKFVNAVRTVHCVHHPTIMEKELFFDSADNIKNIINNFDGYFLKGYTYFSNTFANSIGMVANFKLRLLDNPSEIVSYTILKLVEEFSRNQEQNIKFT
ncbi:MAG: hypothetical protein Q7J54_03330 [Candidatus Woesearchaeota archaeon]|nr:hypothetical protein [Candidatus Woesearchaeota archaeon]